MEKEKYVVMRNDVRTKKWQWFGLAAAIIVIDQISKIYCQFFLPIIGTYEVIPGFFRLALYYNTGAAFGFLANAAGWQTYFFSLLAIAVSCWIAWGIWHEHFVGAKCIGATLILGGAIGNLMDRCLYGYVIDFLCFYYQTFSYPAFNIADSCITIGVIFLLANPHQIK